MSIISVVGPKGGIGKTTLAINAAASLTRALATQAGKNKICLVDLDLRLPTISSILDSHPPKTFYDLFETLANKTYQVDTFRTLSRVVGIFKSYLAGDLAGDSRLLSRGFTIFKTLSTDMFHFSDFKYGNDLYDLFLEREKIERPAQLKVLAPLLEKVDAAELKAYSDKLLENSRPLAGEFINFIEEFGFSIIGGEVPIMGKKNHRKRINEPAFLMLFLEFLDEIYERFDHVVLDTPAGGVSHISSLMNSIDQVVLVFDMSNGVAINGSLDALHSFIDYYEEFFEEFTQDRLTGLDKAYVNRLITAKGHRALEETLRTKSIGVFFNRCRNAGEITDCLHRLREYLDTLDKLTTYKDRIHIVGMMPQHKIIQIANNRGTLFYDKDKVLQNRMDMVAQGVLTGNASSPTLASSDDEILKYLQGSRSSLAARFSRLAGSFS